MRNKVFLSALKVFCGNLYRFVVEMRSTGLKVAKTTFNDKQQGL